MSAGERWARALVGTRVDELLRAALAKLVDMAIADALARAAAVVEAAPELGGILAKRRAEVIDRILFAAEERPLAVEVRRVDVPPAERRPERFDRELGWVPAPELPPSHFGPPFVEGPAFDVPLSRAQDGTIARLEREKREAEAAVPAETCGRCGCRVVPVCACPEGPT